jgi:hypothetical protein
MTVLGSFMSPSGTRRMCIINCLNETEVAMRPGKCRLLSPLPCAQIVALMFGIGLLGFGGCAGSRQDKPAFPQALNTAALAFRSKAPSNRFSEATNLVAILPNCPVMSSPLFMGKAMAHDYSRPSYSLTANEVCRLLGPPDALIEDAYYYCALRSAKDRALYLRIQLHDDRVMYSLVTPGPDVSQP